MNLIFKIIFQLTNLSVFLTERLRWTFPKANLNLSMYKKHISTFHRIKPIAIPTNSHLIPGRCENITSNHCIERKNMKSARQFQRSAKLSFRVDYGNGPGCNIPIGLGFIPSRFIPIKVTWVCYPGQNRRYTSEQVCWDTQKIRGPKFFFISPPRPCRFSFSNLSTLFRNILARGRCRLSETLFHHQDSVLLPEYIRTLLLCLKVES